MLEGSNLKVRFKYFSYLVIILLVGRMIYLKICERTHDFTDMVWQPYQVGDCLKFISDQGDSVQWVINYVESSSGPADPLLPLTHRIYCTFVKLSISTSILYLREESGRKTIEIIPNFQPGGLMLVENKTRFDTLDYNQIEIFSIKNIEPNYFRGDDYLNRVYWSPKFGMVKLFYSKGTCWELKSFERKGDIIYELKE